MNLTTFFSAKGGTGQTLISTNYAFLKSRTARTAFIQLTNYPDAHTFFNLSPRTNYVHILEFLEADEENLNILEQLVYKSESLSIILSPEKNSKEITEKDVEKLLGFATRNFDEIVIDLGHDFQQKEAILTRSKRIITVSNIDPQSISKTNILLNKLQETLPATESKLILNQIPPHLSKKKLQEYFTSNIWALLPYDMESSWDNIALGTPYTLHKSPLSKRTTELIKN